MPARSAAKISVAPMMDWTDRHCRYLHRLLSNQTLLYTEMVTAPALVRGGAMQLLDFDPSEHPVAVQLGGSDPVELAQATRMCCDAGYDEVNLNIGCPSDRVQSGAFGAVLMKSPEVVADCAAAMIAASTVEVTVKCRIGVDQQTPQEILPQFLETVAAAGVRRFTIHARMAWLQGLSPKENRTTPPLDYELVYQMKRTFPKLHLSLNGGVSSLNEARSHLRAGMDGVMIGRAAYQRPTELLQDVDQQIFDVPARRLVRDVVLAMVPYIDAHVAGGGRAHHVTRHMMGLFAGKPGARNWRRTLSEGGADKNADSKLLIRALSELEAASETCQV